MLMDCMTLIKHFWLKQQKSSLEYSSKNEMNWNITSRSTEWPRGWRAEEELATPDHSAPQVSLHHPLWVLAVAFKCFNPLVTLVEIHFKEGESQLRLHTSPLATRRQRTSFTFPQGVCKRRNRWSHKIRSGAIWKGERISYTKKKKKMCLLHNVTGIKQRYVCSKSPFAFFLMRVYILQMYV